MKITLDVSDLYQILKVIYLNQKYCSLVLDNQYQEYFRLVLEDEKLFIVYNNTINKIIYELKGGIKTDLKLDYFLNVKEVFNIINNLKMFKTVDFEVSKVEISYKDKIYFCLKNEVYFSKEIRDSIFSVTEYREKGEDNNYEVELEDEENKDLKKIKNILELRNNRFNNTYYCKDDFYFFNFTNIFVKKKINKIKIEEIDLFNYRLLCRILKLCNIKDLSISKVNNTVHILLDKNIKYIILNTNSISEQDRIEDLFNKNKVIGTIRLNLEIINFLSCIINIEPETTLVFDRSNIYTQGLKNDDMDYVFYTDESFDMFFVMNVVCLYKIIKALFLLSKNLEYVDIYVINYKKRSFLCVKNEEVEIMTEILKSHILDEGDKDDVEEDNKFDNRDISDDIDSVIDNNNDSVIDDIDFTIDDSEF